MRVLASLLPAGIHRAITTSRVWRRLAQPEFPISVSTIARRAPEVLADRLVRPRILSRNVEHVAGPLTIESAETDVIVLSVVRNAALHLGHFLEHHFRLGVRHVVLLDNGSTDGTPNLAKRYRDVTVLHTSCPYRRYEIVMKRYLVQRFARDRWHLFVDIDERFDYPHSDRVPLPSLIRYLNAGAYQVLVAQMLDLFPDSTLGELDHGADFAAAHRFYDLSAIEKTRYFWGAAPGSAVRMHLGGIRGQIFGTLNGLTKAALVRADDGVEVFVGWHHTRFARIAELTGVLLHYPFAGGFESKVQDAATTGRYGRSATQEYRQYWQVLQQSPDRALRQATARVWDGLPPLVQDGFLIVPDDYLRWADRLDNHGLK